jgi:hypothetical protein
VQGKGGHIVSIYIFTKNIFSGDGILAKVSLLRVEDDRHMPNTITVTGKVDIVDLIRDRKRFPLLDVPAIRVTVTFELTTTATIGKATPAPSAKVKRLEDAARVELNRYEDTITKECEKFSKQIDGLIKAGKQKEAQAVVSTVNTCVKNALASAQGAAEKAVEDARKKEAQSDKLLTEARVKTAVKVTFAGIDLAASAAKLVATSGADVTSYFSIAKTMVSLGLELKQQLKGEEALRKDLKKGIDAYLALRSTTVMEAAKANGLTNTSGFPGFPQVFKYIGEQVVRTGKQLTKGKDAGQVAKDVLAFTMKGVMAQYNDAEKARQMYRNHTAKMRHHVDGISAQADKLMAAMKGSTTLKDGVKIGAQCMQVKSTVRTLAGELDQAKGFLDAMEAAMKGMGLQCDDRTVIEKLRAIDKATIFTEGADVVSNIYSVYGLFENVAAAVA